MFKVKDMITSIIISLLVIYGWQGLELLINGEITPNKVDTIVGIILSASIYLNLALFKIIKEN